MNWSIQIAGETAPVTADEGCDDAIVVILAHGAGSHMGQSTVLWLADLIRSAGAPVIRFNFLYRAQGKSVPDRMPRLMETYRAVIQSVRERLEPKKLVIGGHSMGGRVASMIEAEGQSADGLLLLGYPLHPARQPEKLRDGHLGAIATPTLQINGTEDPLCTKEIMEDVASTLDPDIWHLHWIEGADHSYSVKKSSGRTKADVSDEIRQAVSEWMPTS